MRKRDIATVSEIDPVSIARSNGVKKKEGFLVRLNNRLAGIVIACIYLWLALIALGGAIFIILGLRSIGVLIVAFAVLCFIWFKLLRRVRKRWQLVRRLKKKCKALGARLIPVRGFFKGLRRHDDGLDYLLDTGTVLWQIRFYAVKRYRSTLVVDGDCLYVKAHKLTFMTKVVRKSGYSALPNSNATQQEKKLNAIGTVSPIVCDRTATEALRAALQRDKKRARSRMWEMPNEKNRKIKSALILNPTACEAYKRVDGSNIPIGTGEPMGTYTLFTGSGFINALDRED